MMLEMFYSRGIQMEILLHLLVAMVYILLLYDTDLILF